MSDTKGKVSWTNPTTGEKYVHIERSDGTHDLVYGPKDSAGNRNHGHAVYNEHGSVIYNRNPKGE